MHAKKHLDRAFKYTLLALFLTSCGSGPRLSYQGTQEKYKPKVAVLQSNSSTPTAMPPEYRLSMLDELEVRVRYHDRYNDQVTVRPDGRITLVDIGDLFVLGQTPSNVDSMVTAAYARIITDPEVTITIRKFASMSVYVFGEVRTSGMFEFQPNMTVLQALAMSGGPVRGAKLNSVVLLRRLETNQPEAIRLNLDRGAIASGESYDLYLQPKDILFVPRTFIASTVEFLDQIYDGLLPPVDAYIRAIRTFDAINQDND